MNEYLHQSRTLSHISNKQPRAARQAPVEEIVRMYMSGSIKEHPLQLQGDDEDTESVSLEGEGESVTDTESWGDEEVDEEGKITAFLRDLTGELPAAYEIDYFKKAHGEGITRAKDITDNQKKYQDWLSGKVEDGKIMDNHRSVGFEYEFATYKIVQDGLTMESHTEVGHSRQLSRLFKIPFKLETDSEEELEIVTPPFIIADIKGAVGRDAVRKIYNSYRNAAVEVREENKGKRVGLVNMVDKGFGNIWKFSPQSFHLVISKTRAKHTDSKDAIYSQMNISLTPGEIADFMDEQSMDYVEDQYAETLAGTELFSKAYFRIWNLLDEKTSELLLEYDKQSVSKEESGDSSVQEYLPDDVKSTVESANILISRALSNILALPGILCNQDYRDKNLLDSTHSQVKEIFGIWVKDTIQHILFGLIADDNMAAGVIRNALKAKRKEIVQILFQEVGTDENNAFPRANLDEVDHEKTQKMIDDRQSEFMDDVKKEAKASLDKILAVLKGKEADFNYDTIFLNESFDEEDAGYGVRKDTFVKIKSGTERELFLAEIRGEENIDKYVSSGR